MQETLVKDTEQRIEQGFGEIASSVSSGFPARGTTKSAAAAVPVVSPAGNEEPTKGVQAYIPLSQYRRLNDIKLTRRENIATLVAQAIELWLDVQEGKVKVNITT